PFGVRRPLERLNHAALTVQLLAVLDNRALPDRTRDLALDIAEACSVVGVGSRAAQIALDDSEPLDLRVSAAHAVAAGGFESDRRQLIPLVLTPPASDEADDLKGATLLSCWRLLSPIQLFSALTRPRRPNWGGAYGR